MMQGWDLRRYRQIINIPKGVLLLNALAMQVTLEN
jgi:hypothetical protein